MLWRRKIKNKILCYELGFEMYLLHGIKKKKSVQVAHLVKQICFLM